MYSYNKLNRAVRLALLVSATTAVALPAAAQQSAEPKSVERIAVTGSKIKRIGELSPTPVTVISGDTMVDAGITNVGELLSDMPNAVPGLSPETTNNTLFASGLNLTALRNLGYNRTLVLVNGRRFVGSNPGNTAVDLNNIPSAMIERIEVTTGGASAVYGSDAVAGVVNIVTKKTIDGFEFDAATTRPQQEGGEENFYSFTFGGVEGDTDFITNVTYADQGQVRGDARDFVRNAVIGIDNPANKNGTDGIPGRIIWDQTGNPILRTSHNTGASQFGTTFYAYDRQGNINLFNENDGQPYPFVAGSTAQNSRYLASNNGPGDGYNTLAYRYLRTPLERLNISANIGHQINDDHRANLELTYAESKATGEGSPAFFSGTTALKLSQNYAFFSDATRKFFTDNSIKGDIPVGYIAQAFGNRQYAQDRTLARAALSFEGQLTEDWSYDAYLNKGKVDADTTWYGEMLRDRFFAGLTATRDANGKVSCNNCVPLDIFNPSAQAVEWISTDAERLATLKQDSAAFTVSGDLFELPAGMVASAFGVEYRKEATETRPDINVQTGALFGNKSVPYAGEYSVREASAEVSVPLLTDLPMVQDLMLESAVRLMDYSTSGSDEAWKLSLNYTINDELRFRVNRSKSVRAPNVGELYNPASQTFSTLNDPCEQKRITNAGNFKENITNNCRAAGLPEGWKPTDGWLAGGNKSGFITGNAQLVNERAYDITTGFVYTPELLEGLSITVDYWKFNISDMITSHGAQTVVDNCYQLDSLNNPYCALFVRDPVTKDIIDYTVKPMNSAQSALSGVDIETNYKFDLADFGALDLRLMATYLENYEQNATGEAKDNREYQGSYGYFRWKGRFTANYSIEDLTVVLGSSYTHDSVYDRSGWTPEVNNFNEIGSYTSWDLTSRYSVTDNLQLRAGVLNMFDRQPIRNPSTFDQGEFYDILGRRFTVGVNYKF